MTIPGFSQYTINESGIVTHKFNNRPITPVLSHARSNHYYLRVTLIDDEGKRRMHNVIHLLALAYVGPQPRGAVATAIDGDFTNTQVSNVAWVQRSDCMVALWSAGKIHRKPRKNNSCTEETISMLYDAMEAFDEPVPMTELSMQLQVPYSTIRYSMRYLVDTGKARRTPTGYEVIK